MRSVYHLTLALSSRRGEIYGSASVHKERGNVVFLLLGEKGRMRGLSVRIG